MESRRADTLATLPRLPRNWATSRCSCPYCEGFGRSTTLARSASAWLLRASLFLSSTARVDASLGPKGMLWHSWRTCTQ